MTEISLPPDGEMTVADISIRWYKSKIDWWLIPLLAAPPIASVVATVVLVQTGDPMGMFAGFGSMLLVSGIYFGLVFPLRYGIGGDCLLVQFGVCRHRIALADIVEVRRTWNPLSSPALSLDRLQIRFGTTVFKSIMISPAQREQFLSDLAQSAGLQREGGRLLRVVNSQ
jgi:Bacterial PH domain